MNNTAAGICSAIFNTNRAMHTNSQKGGIFMDTLKKKLIKRKEAYQEYILTLESLYTECGEILFDYAIHSVQPLTVIDQNLLTAWNTAREERKKHTSTILTIKAALTRQDELKKFSSEITHLLQEQNKQYKKHEEAFALHFFEMYEPEHINELSHIEQELLPLKTALEKIFEEKAFIEQEKENGTFFKKIAAGSQLIILNNKQSNTEKKIKKCILSHAKDINTCETVTKLYEQHSFSEETAQLYDELQRITVQLQETQVRQTSVDEEVKQIKKIFEECGAGHNPRKYITELTSLIRKLDDTIQINEKQQGCAYADQFYTEEGVQKDNTPEKINEQRIIDCLTAINEQRIHITQKNYEIAYIENEIAIETETNRIASITKAIISYEKKIEEYQKRIEQANKDILSAEAVIQECTAKNEDIIVHIAKPEDE